MTQYHVRPMLGATDVVWALQGHARRPDSEYVCTASFFKAGFQLMGFPVDTSKPCSIATLMSRSRGGDPTMRSIESSRSWNSKYFTYQCPRGLELMGRWY